MSGSTVRPEEALLALFGRGGRGAETDEDADLAFARILQEQEAAFLRTNRSLHNDMFRQTTVEEAAVSDEEFARRLQDEEAQAHYEQLLQLQGLGAEAEYDEGYASEDSVDPDNMSYEELQALGDTVGTVSRGVSQQVIDALPTTAYGDMHAAAAGGEEEQCAICRMEFGTGDRITVLPCDHHYHPECIARWLQINKVCPICNKEVTVPARKTKQPRSKPRKKRVDMVDLTAQRQQEVMDLTGTSPPLT